MSLLSAQRLTIAARLVLINLLLGAAVIAVSASAWRALDAQTGATSNLLRISQAQRLHQDADMLHDNIRGDVYSSFLPEELSHQTPAQVTEHLREDIRDFRNDLVNLSKIDVSPEINQAN